MDEGREKEDAEKTEVEDEDAFLTASSGESDFDDDDDVDELNENDVANFRNMLETDYVTDRDRLLLDRVSFPPTNDAFPDVFAPSPRREHRDRDEDDDDVAAANGDNIDELSRDFGTSNMNNNGDNRTCYARDRDKTSISSVSEKDCDTEKERNAYSPTAVAAAVEEEERGVNEFCDQKSAFVCDSARDEDEGAGWNEFSRPAPLTDDEGEKPPPPPPPPPPFKSNRDFPFSEADELVNPETEAASKVAATARDDASFIDEESLAELEKSMTVEEKEKNRQVAKQRKAKGNEFFKKSEWSTALEEYNSGLRICPLMYQDDRSVLYANRAAVRLKMDSEAERENAILDCGKALELNPKYLKARLRRAQTYEQLDKLESALEDYQKALEQDPSNRDAFEACRRLPDVIKEKNEKLKEEMMGKLKDLGNMVLKPFGLSTNNFQLQQDPNSGGYTINFKQN